MKSIIRVLEETAILAEVLGSSTIPFSTEDAEAAEAAEEDDGDEEATKVASQPCCRKDTKIRYRSK
jgi:hypothetical protein